MAAATTLASFVRPTVILLLPTTTTGADWSSSPRATSAQSTVGKMQAVSTTHTDTRTLLYENVAGVRFFVDGKKFYVVGGGVEFGPPPECEGGFIFGEHCLYVGKVADLVPYLKSIRTATEEWECPEDFSDDTKALIAQVKKLPKGQTLGNWYVDQLVSIDGKIYVSGEVKPLIGPVAADYVKLAHFLGTERIDALLESHNLGSKVKRSFGQYDLISFYHACMILNDLRKCESPERAIEKAHELNSILNLIQNPAYVKVFEKNVDEVLKNSKFKKNWKDIIL